MSSKDGSGGSQTAASEEEDSEVEIVKTILYKAPGAPSGSLKLEELAGLPYIPHALSTLGGGRCSIAAPMLAVGRLPDNHVNHYCQARVDVERIALGESMREPRWSEERWMREVPVDLRMDRVQIGCHVDPTQCAPAQTSYHALHESLTDPARNREWLEPSVFYLTADEYGVGIFVIQVYPERGSNITYYRHIRPASKQHIVIWFANGHYQCVQYNRQRMFPTGHEFVQRLQLLCVTHARPVGPDPDIDQQIIAERLKIPSTNSSPSSQQSGTASSAVPDPAPLTIGPGTGWKGEPPTDLVTPTDQQPRRRQRLARKAKEPRTAILPALNPHQTGDLGAASNSPAPKPIRRTLPGYIQEHSVNKRTHPPRPTLAGGMNSGSTQPPQKQQSRARTSSGPALPVADSLPTVSEVATHGPLYDFVSFSNVPQWVGMCSLAFNAYRTASQDSDGPRQTQALVDLLLLPQKVLTKTNRAGAHHRRRLVATIKARCRDVGAELRMRFQCREPVDNNVQLTVTTAELLHEPAPPPAPTQQSDVGVNDDILERGRSLSTAFTVAMPTVLSRPSQTDEEEHIENDDDEDGDMENNHRGPWSRRLRSTTSASASTASEVTEADVDDMHAARRAGFLVCRGHIKRASQALHSTSALADLSDPTMQDHLRLLHPALPASSVLPPLPANARHTILEDDEQLKRLIRGSNNGACSGPSGWGGNLLSSLVESHICRAGIAAVLKDIVNGTIPEQARQYVLASRLFGITKPDNGARPIAVGELFYKLAGVLAVRNVTAAAATLLAPHQYGVGVASGCEGMVHAMQHTLTDPTSKRMGLKVDISNAFNSCDRAELLRKVYAIPQLAPLYRMADFAYSVPSQLLLQGCDGLAIESSNGVRQGDPLACLLFCIYMRDLYEELSQQADVTLYAYVDDLHVVGTPAEVMKALAALQRLLPAASLRLNTNKSHVAYFHSDSAPLQSGVLNTLASNDITLHTEWMEVVGAVIGRDEQAIQRGARQVFHQDGNDAFFRRLQSVELSVQSAFLLLRQCAVPQMNYLLRCTPPKCIAELAREFDDRIVEAARDKLEVRCGEVTDETIRLLRQKLSNGGFGLKSALATSPAAFLGSVAAARSARVFDPYAQPDCPLPSDTLLHQWLGQAMKLVTDDTPAAAEYLPPSAPAAPAASSFFSFYATAKSSLSSTLQRNITTQAAQHSFEASLTAAKKMKKQDGGVAYVHLQSYSAKGASTWKSTIPTGKILMLTDTQYRLAARLSLRLQPFAHMGELPASCPLCKGDKAHNAIADDGWHFLSCKSQSREQSVRHNTVVDALYHTALTVGGQAVREPQGLSAEDGRRPDLQLVFPGQHLLTDVVVVHPLSRSRINAGHRAGYWLLEAQRKKRVKYARVAADHGAQLLPFAVETSGSLAPDAMALLDTISRAGREHLALWPHYEIQRQMAGAVAVAIQRGNAMLVLGGYSMTVAKASGGEERGWD
jgi:hypothetical protein